MYMGVEKKLPRVKVVGGFYFIFGNAYIKQTA